jgi:Holliday junction resolvase RusA-like endonuclease
MKITTTPIGKPRMTQRDRWAKRPVVLRYFAFCDEVRQQWQSHRGVQLPERIQLIFYLPMPSSWSKRKKEDMRSQPHQQRPDIDNLVKAVLDALYPDDSIVYAVQAEKYWDDKGAIMVEGY